MTDSEMLDELLDLDEGLSNWEVGFIESLFQKRKQTGTLNLSDMQRKKLHEVYGRLCK